MDNTQTRYDYYKQLHPQWSDDQIWAAISVEMNAENVLAKEGDQMKPNDPDVIREILTGARDWLQDVLPNVFARVGEFFNRMISSLGEWISKGLTYVVEAIAKLLNKD